MTLDVFAQTRDILRAVLAILGRFVIWLNGYDKDEKIILGIYASSFLAECGCF